MIGAVREQLKVLTRSSGWSKVRKEVIQRDKACRVCGKKKNLQVHHIVPFHILPQRELDKNNLVTLCGRCHLLIGHKDNWKDYNLNVATDAMWILTKILRRVID